MVVKPLIPGSATHHLLHTLCQPAPAPAPASGRETGVPPASVRIMATDYGVPRQRPSGGAVLLLLSDFQKLSQSRFASFKQTVTFVSTSYSIYI